MSYGIPEDLMGCAHSFVRNNLRHISDNLLNGKFDFVAEEVKYKKPEIFTESTARDAVLARGALEVLPSPLRTLLLALRELKIDIVNEFIRQWTNSDASIIARLESVVDYAIRYLQDLSRYTAQISKESLLEMQDSLICEEIFAETGSREIASIERELEACHSSQQQFLLEASQKMPMIKHRSEPTFANIDFAIDSSRNLRKRLKNLSEGPLSEFYEPLSVETKNPADEKSPVVMKAEKLTETDQTIKIERLQSILRRHRKAFDGIQRGKQKLLDMHIKTNALSLAGTNLEYAMITVNVPEDMKNADKKIQEEIKLLLSTLSTDRSSLDQYLRSIRLECDALQRASFLESSNSIGVYMTQWKLRLEMAWISLVETK